jgi:hypothetical protein
LFTWKIAVQVVATTRIASRFNGTMMVLMAVVGTH